MATEPGGGLISLWAALRQYWFPPEFRIAPPAWPTNFDSLLGRLGAEGAPSPAPAQSTGGPSAEMLAEVATGLWRLRQRMVDPDSGRPLEEMRRAFRHLESVWDALAAAGVEVQDHTGMAFHTGLALDVLAFQPTAGVERERVIETIKPSVYFKGRAIQMGQVIVGTPAGGSPAS